MSLVSRFVPSVILRSSRLNTRIGITAISNTQHSNSSYHQHITRLFSAATGPNSATSATTGYKTKMSSSSSSSSSMAPPLGDVRSDLSKMPPPPGKNAVELIKTDHRIVESLGDRYWSCQNQDEKRGIAYNIIKLLSIHGAAEEMAVYPHIKKHIPQGEGMVQHALKEHQQMKEDLYALDSMEFGAPGYDAKLKKVLEDTLHHVKEEESSILPALEKNCPPDSMKKMTDDFLSSKSMAPSRPHPDAPNEPPANKIANAATVPLDAARDIGRFHGTANA